MKYFNYTDLGIVSAKKPFNTHLFWELNNGYLLLVDSTSRRDLLISTDKGANWDNFGTGNFTSGKITDDRNIIGSYFDRDNDIIYFIGWEVGVDGDKIQCWQLNVSTYTASDIGASIDANNAAGDAIGIDVWVRDNKVEVLLRDDNGASLRWEVFQWVDPNWVYKAFVTAQDTLNIPAVIIGTNAYFVRISEVTHTASIERFDGANLSTRDGISNADGPSDDNMLSMAYDGNNILYFSLYSTTDAENRLFSWSITGVEETKLGKYDIILMLDRNAANLEKAFHITEYRIYQLQVNNTQLNLISIPDTGEVIIAITDNFLMTTTGKMFEYEDKIKKLITVDIVHEIMEPPGGDITLKRDTIPIENNMVMKFIDNYTSAGSTSEEIVFEGIIYKHTETDNQTANLESSAEADLDEKPSGDYSGRSDEIITSLLIDYCHYITKGTFSVGTAMGTITFGGDKTLGTILDELAYFENWIWYITPTGVLYYNNGTVDSGVNLSESDNVHFVTPTRPREIYNRIKVKGAYVDGVQVESEWKEDLESQQTIGIKTKTFTFGFLNTIALCNTTAINLLTRLGKEPLNVIFTHQDETIGFMQPGETITFEFNRGGIIVSSDQFLITEVIYTDQSVGVYTIRDELP